MGVQDGDFGFAGCSAERCGFSSRKFPGRTTLYQRPVVSIASTVRSRGGAVAFTFSW